MRGFAPERSRRRAPGTRQRRQLLLLVGIEIATEAVVLDIDLQRLGSAWATSRSPASSSLRATKSIT